VVLPVKLKTLGRQFRDLCSFLGVMWPPQRRVLSNTLLGIGLNPVDPPYLRYVPTNINWLDLRVGEGRISITPGCGQLSPTADPT
jgi:hypothetical protein